MNMSHVLNNPHFLEQLICKRQLETVGEDGMASFAPLLRNFQGVVTSAGGRELSRGADSAQLRQKITIITTFQLTDGKCGTSADIVRWHGKDYTVTQVDDYRRHGFVQATAELTSISG